MRTLTLLATLLALCVVVLGAYTRLTDAGLGCPDWPGCYGHLAVPGTPQGIATASAQFNQAVEPRKAWTEMTHRYLAATLGLCVVILGGYALLRSKRQHYGAALPLFLVGLVVFQGLLGMWTVTLKLSPPIILLHLLGGLSVLSLLWWQFLRLHPSRTALSTEAKSLHPWIVGGIGLLVLQIALGGWTSANYAAIICPDFPYCQGQLIPPMKLSAFFSGFAIATENTQLVTIHMAHRFGAIIVATYLGLLALGLIFSKKNQGVRPYGFCIGALLITQVSLGILNILWSLPLKTAVLHNLVAALLLLSLVALLARCQPPSINPLLVYKH